MYQSVVFSCLFDVPLPLFDVLIMLTNTSNKVMMYAEYMFPQNVENI